MARFVSHRVSLANRKVGGHGQVYFPVQPIADPTGTNFRSTNDPRHMLNCVADFVQSVGIDAIQYSKEDGLGSRPEDAQDRRRDRQPDEGVCQREFQPNPDGTSQDGQTREPIDPRMISVSDQRRAVDLPANPDPEDRDKLIPQETNDGGHRDRTDIADGLRIEDPIDGFIAGDHGTQQDQEYNRRPGQIFDLAIAVWETLRRPQSG